MTATAEVRVRRVYDPPDPADGRRVLVDRLWPRGMSKSAAALDEWLRAIAPSDELRRWYGHEVGKFAEFRDRYLAELRTPERAEALAHLRQAAPSHDTAYDLLLVGRTYQRLAPADPPLVLRAAEVFTEAADQAQRLDDARALSYAWGYLGRLYEDEGRAQEALQLTRRAALAAQRVYLPESLYLWQWQTGRLLRALGEIDPALAAYERAVATVQLIRPELLRGAGGANPDEAGGSLA